MIIDFHTHIFPKEIRNNREKYFHNEPAFKLLYESEKARMMGAKESVCFMSRQGVHHTVVFGFPWKSADTNRMHNDYIIESIQKYPENLIGFGCFDPMDSKAILETRRCLENGLSGIGELAFYGSGIGDQELKHLEPIMEICRDKNVPLMIHTNEPVGHEYPGKSPNTLRQIHNLVQTFHHNKIVLAHWGGGLVFFNLLKKGFKESLKNVYFDTAATPYIYDSQIYQTAVEIMGSDKILFGSDWPLLPPERYFQEMEKSGIKEKEIKNICGLNAKKLLNL